MPTSGSAVYATTRDQVITRALRICSAIGQGETPSATAITEANQCINDLIKEWQADGMQLWKIKTCTPITLAAGQGSYVIAVGGSVNQIPPLKIFQMWMRNIATGADSPGNIWTKNEYDRFAAKSTLGTPTILYYNPPSTPSMIGSQTGTAYLLPVPDANAVSQVNLMFTGLYPLEDMSNSTDNPDFPAFYYNALVWNLAGQLSYEYSVPLSERAMIDKKAAFHLDKAQGFDVEEGSLYLMPQWEFGEG